MSSREKSDALPSRSPYEGLCAVPAHPNLREEMRRTLAAAKANDHDIVKELLEVRFPVRFGLNDAVIYPAHTLGPGTAESTIRSAAPERAPTGVQRVIVVLVNFQDKQITQSKQHYQDLFFSTGVVSTGSVSEFYKEVTNGLVTIAGDVVGPFTLPQTAAYYANNGSGLGGATPNATTMARDAAVAANPTVDFKPYDNNGDGFVDAFIVVHPGPGGEVSGNKNDIWSHKWTLDGGAYAADGVNLYAYLTIPEDAKLGVCAHELGHLLFALPDLYDTDYSSNGIGQFCLMAGGSWNNGGNTPAHPSAWCKAKQNWVTVTNQAAAATLSISDVKTSRNVVRLWKDGVAGQEYFLLENRQKKQFDQFIPGDGLLIWHIDDGINGNTDDTHPQVKLLQADGLDQLRTAANQGDSADPFPGAKNNTVFNASSNPNSKSYGGVDTCVSVIVGPSGPAMSVQVTVSCPTGPKDNPLPLYRYWNAQAADHFYTTNWGELGGGAHGWAFESIQCYVHGVQIAGTAPLHRYWNSQAGDHFYTINWGELGSGAHGWAYEGIACYVHSALIAGAVPLYRYWNAQAGDHFYTTNWAELGQGAHGWAYEGIAGYVHTQAGPQQSEGPPTSAGVVSIPETFRVTEPAAVAYAEIPATFRFGPQGDDAPVPASFRLSRP